jgi:hypothetical protein
MTTHTNPYHRSLIGQLNWLARSIRPDLISFTSSLNASSFKMCMGSTRYPMSHLNLVSRLKDNMSNIFFYIDDASSFKMCMGPTGFPMFSPSLATAFTPVNKLLRGVEEVAEVAVKELGIDMSRQSQLFVFTMFAEELVDNQESTVPRLWRGRHSYPIKGNVPEDGFMLQGDKGRSCISLHGL